MVTEYCSLGSLDVYLDKGITFTEQLVAFICRSVLTASANAVRHGILSHHDIKPGNVFIRDDGDVLLGDWAGALVTPEYVSLPSLPRCVPVLLSLSFGDLSSVD